MTTPTIFDLATHLVATLATVKDFPIVAKSTMSLTMTMKTAPVFHEYDSMVGTRLGVKNVVLNQWVVVESFPVKGCWCGLVLDEASLHVVSLHL